MKTDTEKKINGFSTHKSYSPEEVLAAGGTTAFAIKQGKTAESLVKALESVGKTAPFTDEEWKDFLLDMEKDK